MTSQHAFAVGDVALFVRDGSQYFGVEVTIVRPLHESFVRDQRDGSRRLTWVYGIDGPIPVEVGRFLAAEPHDLRKRRAPQDWQTLCNLEEREHELEIA